MAITALLKYYKQEGLAAYLLISVNIHLLIKQL